MSTTPSSPSSSSIGKLVLVGGAVAVATYLVVTKLTKPAPAKTSPASDALAGIKSFLNGLTSSPPMNAGSGPPGSAGLGATEWQTSFDTVPIRLGARDTGGDAAIADAMGAAGWQNGFQPTVYKNRAEQVIAGELPGSFFSTR